MFYIEMKFNLFFIVLATIFLRNYARAYAADKECSPIQIPGKSSICVCSPSYCDTITRIPPTDGSFISYTTSKAGMRFSKAIDQLQNADCCTAKQDVETLILDPDTSFQTIQGFGGAVTDSAAMNWKDLPQSLQSLLIISYFSVYGLQYNMIRVPIGGTDFSTHAYAYNDCPENDGLLSNFSLSYEDYQFKIPMIKAAMAASKAKIQVVASTWSPPPWMKTNKVYTGYSRLKPEYYQTYASYHIKFLEKYKLAGIPIWGITTTNEPTNGLTGMCFGINCLGWSAFDMGKWIVNNLGPAIRDSQFKDVKILAGDDQRLTIPYWMNLMVTEHSEVLTYIDGVAVHYYTDFLAPASLLTELSKFYPGKFILATEACSGSMWFIKNHVDFGSWTRAKSYITDIISDLNHNVVGWIDWNLCLNSEGGPTWAKNFVDSPIIVFPKIGVFIKQPMFYAMGHFSKFIPRGSKRIKTCGGAGWSDSVLNVAFLTPQKTVVVVLYNGAAKEKKVNLKLCGKLAAVTMLPDSVSTIEIPYNQDSKTC